MTTSEYLEIVRLVNLYAFAIDSQDWELFDQIFTVDVDAFFSDAETSHWKDRASFKRDFAQYHAALDSTQHVMSGHLVNVKGKIAYAFTYGEWRLIKKGMDGGDLWEGTGWYDDLAVRTPGGWRIKSRICRTIWWSGNPKVIGSVPGVKFVLPIDSVKEERLAGRSRFYDSLKR
jgi:hypothetical protein